MTKIYLARHGQNEDNANGILNGHRDLPLTTIGLNQANELAQHVKNSSIQFDRIYSSPLQRAYKTAEAITDTLAMPKPEIYDLLIERDFGILTGRPYSDIEIVCGDDVIQSEKVTYFLNPENAESFPALRERAHKVLETIRANNPDKTVLLVTHGDFGKMLYSAFYDQDWQETLVHFHFGNSELLLLDENSDPHTRHVVKIKQFNKEKD